MEASTAKATEAVKSIASKFSGDQSMPIVVGLIVAVMISFAVAYFLYYVINRHVMNKRPYLFDQTTTPKPGNQITKLYAGEMPNITNGRRVTFSFWIYVHDIGKYRGVPRHVMHIGDDENAVNGSPIVFLGAGDNRLYVAFNKTGTDVIPAWAKTQRQKLEVLAARYGMVFDYLPIQRWVHVGIVVNESVNGGSITGYLDGELVKTVTTGTNIMMQGAIQTTNFQNLMLDKRGSLFIGGSMSSAMGPGFSGLVSKVKFYNHDLNVQDMYNDYRSGPIGGGVLAKLGYGLRTPIYKTGAQ